jgi:allantoinase
MALQAFISQRVVTPDGIRPASILVEDERIRDVVAPDRTPAQARTVDFGNRAILPGLVDSHVHINEPGRTEWEGFATATRAAAAGGYTLLVDMPLNCLPATTTVAALQAKRKASHGQCHVDWASWGGVVPGNHADIPALAAEGVPGFKCFLIHPGIDGFTMVSEQDLVAALPRVAQTGLPLLVHAELPGPIETAVANLAGADWSRYVTYLQSRPEEAELSAIHLLISLCRKYRFHLHVVHLSASEALPLFHRARSEAHAISVETCPHYLHLTAETIPDGATLCKCAPPIRNRENRERLWEGLRDGTIDFVVTDHSPCPPEMKRLREGNFGSAWGGISSLSVALPLMYTEATARGFSLSDIARWMAEGPAKLAGCRFQKGRIAVGYDADFVVFDTEDEFVVNESRLYYRHPVSPYMGEKFRGVVRATYLRGRAVFQEGSFPGLPVGREFRSVSQSRSHEGLSQSREYEAGTKIGGQTSA